MTGTTGAGKSLCSNPELVDGGGLYLSPGFIDLHAHGRAGCDIMDGTAASMETVARNHAEHGTEINFQAILLKRVLAKAQRRRAIA